MVTERSDKDKRSIKTTYSHTNEGMSCRWSEAGKTTGEGKEQKNTGRRENHTEGRTEKQNATHKGTISK